MLQIKNINKEYITGELHQQALKNVSLNLRKNEFVAILGPSGSGKTTLLNIIGGLDKYDSGDLIINGISTKKYKSRDWDSYRNHTIGFVFQSYNLIPHQSILANVELALTISGISKKERRKRAKQALIDVGLDKQFHKKPNQMSGGQMQRVAIARALVNNPDILLADEPTGALDSETSVQVMELLKEVAKDRLVVMVTHNPELADTYANRIVKLKDGEIVEDSNPFEISEQEIIEYKNLGKSSMSIFTSLVLSFNNLKSKLGRTILTSFAGSIGIIGIALILSLSTGVNAYIESIQKETMTSYPIVIEAKSVDLSSLIEAGKENASENVDHAFDGVYLSGKELELASSMTTSVNENNLTDFKKYLDNPNSVIHQYVGENGIVYSYDTKFNVYAFDPDGALVNTDGSTLDEKKAATMQQMDSLGAMSGMMEFSNFEELIPGQDSVISKAVIDNYTPVYGRWPQKYNEIVLILDKNNEIPATVLYELGYLPSKEYKEMLKKIDKGEEVTVETQKFEYADICSKPLYMVPACDMYEKQINGTYKEIKEDEDLKQLAENGIKLEIVGIVKTETTNVNSMITSYVGYTRLLTDYLIDYTDKSEVVINQKQNTEINVLSGLHFSPDDEKQKIADAKKFIQNLGVSDKANMFKSIAGAMYADNPMMLQQMMAADENILAATMDNYLKNPDKDTLLKLYDAYISTGTFDKNMELLGVISKDAPSSVSIYTDKFEDKDFVAAAINDYNKTVTEENQITYTDYVGLLMSSVTTIINVISYVLMAFVAVSLVVSSIMIGIITYISVLERTKEIGILRAIGASKRNISQVFNAETFIIGLCSGVIGILVSALLLIPGNAVIHYFVGSNDINAILPIDGAVLLIVLSVVLTLIGGIIPAKKAAKKDPVTALRSE